MKESLTAAQETQAQELAEAIAQAAAEEFVQLARTLVATDRDSLFGATEFKIRDILLGVGAKLYQEFLAQKKNGYEGSSVTCPGCDHAAAYHEDAQRTIVSLFGPITYQRSYYYCRRCGKGQCPFDHQAGIPAHQLTPAVERLASLAGAVASSFEKGAELLEEMSAVDLSESTLQRTTEDVGARMAALLAAGVTVGPRVVWKWQCDAQGRTVAYASIDATGTRQQGPKGQAAEGRMAYVGSIFNPVPPKERVQPVPNAKREQMQARYLAGLYTLDDMGPLMRQLAGRVGMDKAEVWIVLTDGGSGLEEFAQKNFNRPDLVLILDFYHAASYLEKLAKALHPQEEAKAKSQAEQWCHLLKTEGGALTLAVLRAWDWPARQSAALRAQRAEVDQYFANNMHRMEYPEYQAEGWQIGSGVIESACKTVVGQRLKGAGMRWSVDGAHYLCHVRALYRSEKGQWEAFWDRQFTEPPAQQVSEPSVQQAA